MPSIHRQKNGGLERTTGIKVDIIINTHSCACSNAHSPSTFYFLPFLFPLTFSSQALILRAEYPILICMQLNLIGSQITTSTMPTKYLLAHYTQIDLIVENALH